MCSQRAWPVSPHRILAQPRLITRFCFVCALTTPSVLYFDASQQQSTPSKHNRARRRKTHFLLTIHEPSSQVHCVTFGCSFWLWLNKCSSYHSKQFKEDGCLLRVSRTRMENWYCSLFKTWRLWKQPTNWNHALRWQIQITIFCEPSSKC